VQEATVLEGYEPSIEIEAGEIVVRRFYMNEAPRANNWFTPSSEEIVVRLSQILHPNLKLVPESPDSNNGPKLPAGCNKKQARELGTKLLLIADHNALLDEMQRHDVIDFLEEKDGFMEVSDEYPHSDSENDSDDSDNMDE
jgi:hypothetical protein